MASSYSVDQKVICVFLLFWVSLIYPIDQAKHADFPSIRRLQIFSERCSGSNYVAALLLQHFDFDNCVDLSHLGSSSFHDTYDLVIPIATNNFMFSRVKTTKIDDRKRHCIGLILYRLRSSICRQFSRWLNMKLFIAIGIIQVGLLRCRLTPSSNSENLLVLTGFLNYSRYKSSTVLDNLQTPSKFIFSISLIMFRKRF